MGRTRKVHSTGRFGSRYGVGIRKRVLKVETQQKEKHSCPECSLGVLKRKAAGVYFCTKCKKEFAGGAYVPKTMTGSLIKKMVMQKKYTPEVLEEGLEQPFSEKKLDQKEEKKESKKEKLITKAKSVLGIDKQPLNLLEKALPKQKVEQKTEKKEKKEK